MIQMFVDGGLVYDNRLPDHQLLALSYTAGVNKAGTATITMPPGHPAHDAFEVYKSVVEIYKDGVLVFRGRPLQPSDDFYKRRTITCEGERSFFRDSIQRPYLYQDTPAAIFAAVVGVHNSQVLPDKQFAVGTVTVTDPNDYIRLEGTKAEKVSEVIDDLVDRCGGYIVFTTNTAGDRVVNWYAEMQYRNSQVIEFGSNLTDLTRTTTNKDLATRIIPYGAKDESTGLPITIESVNNGVDYIEDAEAVALRGIITQAVTWSDVTEPANLLRKAQEHLATSKNLITSIQVTAVDLSRLVGLDIDSFREGDLIHVRSKPHGLDEDFLLTDRTEDLLNPGASTISLGKDKTTLTGQTAAGDKGSMSALKRTEEHVRTDYTLNIAAAIAAAQQTLTTLIQQTSESIMLEVSEEYTTNDEVVSAISTNLTQLSDSFTFTFNQLQTHVDENDATFRAHIVEQESYIRMEDGSIILGKSADNTMTLTLENDLIVFKKNGVQFGWWDGVDFHTGNIVIDVNERAQFGPFALIPMDNDSLSILKVK